MTREQRENKVKVLKLINNNDNWEEILSKEPYNLIIKHEDPFVLLKYNQLESDMGNPIVQECRGIIIKKQDDGKYDIASMRFTKFFNYGEDKAAKLNFDNGVEVQQKIDGSLIGVWCDNDEWHISTSGNIDAEKAELQFQTDDIKNYKDLFIEGAIEGLNQYNLNPNYTYMFELVSPYNRIVVPYKETKIYLLAVRDNNTLEEFHRAVLTKISQDINVPMPEYFVCHNLQEAQNAVNKLTENDEHFEGFVLCDYNFNRIKMKSDKYMNLFFIRGDGIFTYKKILKLILDGEDDDILGYFPEYKDDFDKVRRGLSIFITKIKESLQYAENFSTLDKKSFAEQVKDKFETTILFKAYGKKYWDLSEDEQYDFLKEYIDNMPLSKLVGKVEVEING